MRSIVQGAESIPAVSEQATEVAYPFLASEKAVLVDRTDVKKLDHSHPHVPAHEDGRIDETLGRSLSLGRTWVEPV